jgi:hypothetical protein
MLVPEHLRAELGFWLCVGLVAIVSIAIFKVLAAGPLGQLVPSVTKVAALV